MRSYSCAALGALASYAETSANSAALVDPDGLTLNFAELWSQIAAVGRRLEEAGIGSEDTVAILLPLGVGHVIAVLGALNYCVCAPLQPRTRVAEVEAALGKLGASALIVSPEFEAEAQAAGSMGLTILVARNGDDPQDWQIRRADSALERRIKHSDAIFLLVTSATVARAKVVPLTPGNLEAGNIARCDSLRLTTSDRLLLMTSLSHSIGIGTTLAQFHAGGAVIVTHGFDSAAYLRWLDDLGPTWYDCAPTVHQAALAQLMRTPPRVPVSLRFVQSAGSPLPDSIREGLERLLQIPVFNDYGMTEACAIATNAFLPDGHDRNSLGRSRGMQIRIMHSSGESLQAGEEGEIVVRGPAVFRGYEHDTEANSKAFYDGWFRTGDAGRLDEDGNLFVTGRLKEMINRGGEKILPAEVENVVASHPAVLEAAAFGIPHPTLGEDVACAVVLREGSEGLVTAHELRRYAVERLPIFKAPRSIRFVDHIPRGELSKPQRWLLAEQLMAHRAEPTAPEDVTNRRLAYDVDDVFYKIHEMWARLLERNDLRFDEDFFEAGGDSLAAINMLAEVDQRFGSQTSAAAASFLDEPTLAHLTGLVGTARPARPSAGASSELQVFPVRENASQLRLFCVPADKEEGLYFRRLATRLIGQMDVSIMRPANTMHSRALYTFECAGEEMANLVRKTQPEGPYLVGGLCYGGVVAAEAARKLALDGQEVRLILFDVSMPGWPPLLSYGRTWFDRARREWRLLTAGKNSASTNDLSIAQKLAWLKGISGVFVRRVVWSAIAAARPLVVPIQRRAVMTKLLDWAQTGNLPFYRVRIIDAPILHFLSIDEAREDVCAARLGWREAARCGIEEQFVALDHSNVLHESNLPGIVHTLLEWSGARSHENADPLMALPVK